MTTDCKHDSRRAQPDAAHLAQAVRVFVSERFSRFGPNRRNQIARLVFEIAKKENSDFRQILGPEKTAGRFEDIKSSLLKRRFPGLASQEISGHILPGLDVRAGMEVTGKRPPRSLPRRFVVERSVARTDFVARLKRRFGSRCEFTEIDSYKTTVKEKRFTIGDYNGRPDTFYIIREKYDFFRPCPCSLKTVSCGYHNVNLGAGCTFECSYCFLQGYINAPGITIPANLGDFFDAFRRYKQDIRLGSGELTDSLVFDHITEFSVPIVRFFRDFPGSTFEFKTKSDNIDNLLKIPGSDNIVVSWSVNPPRMVEENELFTAPLEKRIKAAEACVRAGYRVGFHFDPVIVYDNWEKDYEETVDRVFSRIDPSRLAWVSLGALRMTAGVKRVIENRFPRNTLLDGPLVTGYDGKYRYPRKLRTEMFTKMKGWIRRHAPKVYLYLCMEEKAVCQAARMAPLIRDCS